MQPSATGPLHWPFLLPEMLSHQTSMSLILLSFKFLLQNLPPHLKLHLSPYPRTPNFPSLLYLFFLSAGLLPAAIWPHFLSYPLTVYCYLCTVFKVDRVLFCSREYLKYLEQSWQIAGAQFNYWIGLNGPSRPHYSNVRGKSTIRQPGRQLSQLISQQMILIWSKDYRNVPSTLPASTKPDSVLYQTVYVRE